MENAPRANSACIDSAAKRDENLGLTDDESASWSNGSWRYLGYPTDLRDEAVKTVLQQTELLCADRVAELLLADGAG